MTAPLAIIVEDDKDLANLFAEALRAAGFEAEIIQDGRNALPRLIETQPAVVVLDLHLPYISGVEILRQIRAEARLAEMRVMITTADSLNAERLRGEADLILLKPISFSQLRDLAARLRPQDVISQHQD